RLAYMDRLRWSPDGRELLVSGSDRSARRGLFRVDAQNGATTPVMREGAGTYRGLEGEWAPDGKAIYYIREDEKAGCSVRVADRELYRASRLHDLAVSPDGRWIAFVSTSSGRDALLAMPAAGGEPRQLASVQDAGISGVEWSRDSRSLLASTP